jgi:hypothetical protein
MPTSEPPQRLVDVDIASSGLIGYDENLFVKELSWTIIPRRSLLPKLYELEILVDSVSLSDDAVKADEIRRIERFPIRDIVIVAVFMLILVFVSVEVLNLLEPSWLAHGERLDAFGQFSN